MGTELFMAAFEELHAIFTPYKALVRGSVNEAFGVRQHALLNQMGPELQRHFERGIDLQRPLNSNIAIFGFGGVIEFAVAGVSGPCIVPSVGAFMGYVIKTFKHHAEGGAHDAPADQHYICLSNGHWLSP